MIKYVLDKVVSDTSSVMMLVTMGKEVFFSIKICLWPSYLQNLFVIKIYILPRLRGRHVW